MKMTKIADGLAVAERGERDREPGKRRDGAQHLEDRVKPAHRPNALADERRRARCRRSPPARSRARRAAAMVRTRQPRPISCGPLTKNGSRIRSRASDQILGRRRQGAPSDLSQASSQTIKQHRQNDERRNDRRDCQSRHEPCFRSLAAAPWPTTSAVSCGNRKRAAATEAWQRASIGCDKLPPAVSMHSVGSSASGDRRDSGKALDG